MLDFKISLLAKTYLLKITLNICGFKMYKFYTTFIDCENIFLVLLLILIFFAILRKKANRAFNTGNLTGLLANAVDM